MTVHQQTEVLRGYVTNHKQKLVEEILDSRTKYATVVLEDIYNPQNSSAVLRTCECMGVQDVHFIEKDNEFRTYRDIVKGSIKWLSTYFYRYEEGSSTEKCLDQLKNEGYSLIATSIEEGCQSIENLDSSKKTAFIFGSEQFGISDAVNKRADQLIKIPMFGFTESYNLSVSAAILLQQFLSEARKNTSLDLSLTGEERDRVRLDWYKKIVKASDLILERAMNEEAR